LSHKVLTRTKGQRTTDTGYSKQFSKKVEGALRELTIAGGRGKDDSWNKPEAKNLATLSF
jgi:hypothetical protein